MSASRESGTEDTEYIIVLDNFGDEWTPIGAFRSKTDAKKAIKVLSKDAEATSDTGPYYPTKESAKENKPSKPPKGLEELHVSFERNGDEIIAISDSDLAVRETCFPEGALRKKIDVYDSTDEFTNEHPEATGEFIDAEKTADDLLDQIN